MGRQPGKTEREKRGDSVVQKRSGVTPGGKQYTTIQEHKKDGTKTKITEVHRKRVLQAVGGKFGTRVEHVAGLKGNSSLRKISVYGKSAKFMVKQTKSGSLPKKRELTSKSKGLKRIR